MERHEYYESSIAAQSKREQLMQEAEEYRFRRHVAALKKLEKVVKEPSLKTRSEHRFPHFTKPHIAPAH